ncbi:MAG: PAS domain-containing sensor histidine kinase [Chromatiales bacterium]|jgi:PAS domain S-box-containing protein
MNNDKLKSSLREQAEKLLNVPIVPSPKAHLITSEDLHHLIHELEVHAVELEIQNTELKETRDELEVSRQRYYNLFDVAPVGYFTLDNKGMVVEVNQAGLHLLGLERDRIVRMPFTTFVAEQDLQPFIIMLRRLRQHNGQERLKLTMKSPTHKGFDAQIEALNVICGGTDKEILTHLIVLDISEQKRLEQQRDMFFSIASHELRTPITNISLSLDLILKQQGHRLPEDIRENLEIANRATQRLRNLIRDILELRKASRADLKIELFPVDLTLLVKETITLNSPFARSLDIEFEVREPVPNITVLGDEGRIVQVLNNLLTNAVKYSCAGSKVQIGIESDNSRARVLVSDKGIGIPKRLRERIFEPFTQIDPSIEDTRHKGSFGLGLSIGRALINMMGGKLDFISQEGSGSTFFFELPRVPAEPNELE